MKNQSFGFALPITPRTECFRETPEPPLDTFRQQPSYCYGGHAYSEAEKRRDVKQLYVIESILKDLEGARDKVENYAYERPKLLSERDRLENKLAMSENRTSLAYTALGDLCRPWRFARVSEKLYREFHPEPSSGTRTDRDNETGTAGGDRLDLGIDTYTVQGELGGRTSFLARMKVDNDSNLDSIRDYIKHRENGSDTDNPDEDFPADGRFTWAKDTRLPKEVMARYGVKYTEGLGDHAWMAKRDCNFLARREREKKQFSLALEANVLEQTLNRHPCTGIFGPDGLSKTALLYHFKQQVYPSTLVFQCSLNYGDGFAALQLLEQAKLVQKNNVYPMTLQTAMTAVADHFSPQKVILITHCTRRLNHLSSYILPDNLQWWIVSNQPQPLPSEQTFEITPVIAQTILPNLSLPQADFVNTELLHRYNQRLLSSLDFYPYHLKESIREITPTGEIDRANITNCLIEHHLAQLRVQFEDDQETFDALIHAFGWIAPGWLPLPLFEKAFERMAFDSTLLSRMLDAIDERQLLKRAEPIPSAQTELILPKLLQQYCQTQLLLNPTLDNIQIECWFKPLNHWLNTLLSELQQSRQQPLMERQTLFVQLHHAVQFCEQCLDHFDLGQFEYHIDFDTYVKAVHALTDIYFEDLHDYHKAQTYCEGLTDFDLYLTSAQKTANDVRSLRSQMAVVGNYTQSDLPSLRRFVETCFNGPQAANTKHSAFEFYGAGLLSNLGAKIQTHPQNRHRTWGWLPSDAHQRQTSKAFLITRKEAQWTLICLLLKPECENPETIQCYPEQFTLSDFLKLSPDSNTFSPEKYQAIDEIRELLEAKTRSRGKEHHFSYYINMIEIVEVPNWESVAAYPYVRLTWGLATVLQSNMMPAQSAKALCHHFARWALTSTTVSAFIGPAARNSQADYDGTSTTTTTAKSSQSEGQSISHSGESWCEESDEDEKFDLIETLSECYSQPNSPYQKLIPKIPQEIQSAYFALETAFFEHIDTHQIATSKPRKLDRLRHHLLKARQKNPPHRILIQGDVGVGKTTLCEYIVADWLTPGQGHWAHGFKLIWHLRLIECIADSALISDLLNHSADPGTLAQRILYQDLKRKWQQANSVREITLSQFNEAFQDLQKNCTWVLLLDGYDELVDHAPTHFEIDALIQALSTIHDRTLLLTRPYALPKNASTYYNETFRLNGVPKDHVEVLIEKFTVPYQTQHDYRYRVQSLIQSQREHPYIKRISQNPLFLKKICKVLFDTRESSSQHQRSQSNQASQARLSLTSWIDHIVQDLYQRVGKKVNKVTQIDQGTEPTQQPLTQISKNSLAKHYQTLESELSRWSYNALRNENENLRDQIILSENSPAAYPVLLRKTGMFNQPDETKRTFKFNFTILLQYYVSRHIAKQLIDQTAADAVSFALTT